MHTPMLETHTMRQTFDELASPDYGKQHLPRLRAEMAKQGLDAFLIPHEDEYQNEYLPACNERLMWISGFGGSAGAAIVMADQAAIFVDGRYTTQVRDQVDQSLFSIHDLVDAGPDTFLKANIKAGQVVGYDARLHSANSIERLRQAVDSAGGTFKAVEQNPLDAAWGDERPAAPLTMAVPHSTEYAGEDHASKRTRVGQDLKGEAAVLTAPTSLAWLLNMRGGDVRCTPLTLGSAILHADGRTELFLDPRKVNDELRAHLGNQVTLRTPDDVADSFAQLRGQRVHIDPAVSAAWWFDQLEAAGAQIVKAEDPCALPRACKNETEVEGSRQAHIRDGVAITRFLHWLATSAEQDRPDEIEIATRLEQFREDTGALKDISFETIAAAGPNAALPHYRPTTRTNRRVESGGILLVDSGGQYLDGTTDITRTIIVGQASDEMRDRFTRVLKGHINLARVRFPTGISGSNLDTLAREPLWAGGFDFDHGTGHGVGSYLGVHEGPQRIAKPANSQAMMPGMIVSNEPGYYKEGHYGIRIENLQVVTPAQDIPGGDRPMLGFEALTMAPIDRNLIAPEMLTPDEKTWLNGYHALVVERLSAHLPADVRAWCEEVCRPL